MNNMLTAKDVQELLQVDRSTVYRMAEDGRLPAVKVGKQWRFPADQLQHSLGSQVNVLLRIPEMSKEGPQPVRETSRTKDLAKMLPIDCVQLIQDSHADLLGVMLVTTDLEGNPVTRPSNPCGLFAEISAEPQAIQRCISSWNDLGRLLNIEPEFHKSHLGLLCARGLIRVGSELIGMVVAGCIAPADWPPSDEELHSIALEMKVDRGVLASRLDQVYGLDLDGQVRVLSTVQTVANIFAHILQERLTLLDRLDSIANLARL
ncbi:MAG: PocR ligand-binding domain-containing protein [Candidatus Promineifilaceae bacterium]